MDLSEKETREKYIDPLLEQEGWLDKYVKKEINSIKSNFKTRKFEFFSLDSKGRFIDYLLVGEDSSPLAIIEAKRFSLNPERGIIQATTYQRDIESQIGIFVPAFLTNGKKWYIKEKDRPMRGVSGPFSQQDLKRRLHLARHKKDLSKVEVNTNIVDRSKSIQITKQILDHFNSGRRSALIAMATGTGKTRVSMAILHILVKHSCIQNVLFVVDRISLGRLAFYNGFQKFFASTPSVLLNEQGFTKDKRFYVSTVQTLMAKKDGEFLFQKFSPGFFDLIIYDEAHRSYYDRNNLIMKYFDALRMGLTATPSKTEAKDTYELFGCERGKPTAEYTYDEAVKDNVLVPYDAQIIETKVLGLGIKGMELDKELKTELIRQDEDPDYFEVPGKRFAKYFTDEKTNELIIEEFMNRCYKTEDGKPCKTIFFCINVKHAEAIRKIFDKLYPNLADEMEVIVSSYDRYMDAVDRFIKESSPRITISVGVLDTGVDIPEIMNLVFVVPVFSHIRFWQMVGRGTRSLSAIKPSSRKLLPIYDDLNDKKDFRILDFKFGDFSNILEHQLDVSKDKKPIQDIRERIFEKELALLKKSLTPGEKEIVEGQIINRVNKIDQRSFIVREYLPMIKKIVSRQYDLKEHVEKIKKEITPLLKFSEFGNSKVQTFISHCVDLFRHVKENDIESIAEVREFIMDRVINVWESDLEAVRKKDEQIKQILQEKFWQEITFEDVDFLIREIAPLMIYYEKEKKRAIRVNAPDYVLDVEKTKMVVKEDPDYRYFINSNPLLKKIRSGEGVTWKELYKISEALAKLNPSWSIDNVQKNQDFILFLRNILELQDLPDPEEMIKHEFDKLIIAENKEYNANQISFLRMLASFFAINKHLKRKDFTTFPLSEERPLEKFSSKQLDAIIKKVEKLKFK